MWGAIVFVSMLFLAAIFEGVHRKLIARFQNRIGPPIWQPLFDLAKLWGKKMRNPNDIFFMLAPIGYFVSNLALFAVIPFSLIEFAYDWIFVLYLTILASAFYSLAGIASDSPYAIVGGMREMYWMIVYEATLAVCFVNFFIYTGATSFSDFGIRPLFAELPLSAIALIVLALVELKITPFEAVEAETEILHSVETEYWGRQLFFMEWGTYLKRLFYVLLLPLFLFGTTNPLLYVGGAFGALVFLSYCQATTPRYRLDYALKVLFVFLLFALIEYVRISWGIRWAL